MNKKICLTFDWEMFLGEYSGTIEKCILEPTEKLLLQAEKFSIPMVFFIDVLQLMRMEEFPEEANRLVLLKEQIHKMIKLGCRPELHLHPHWLDAQYLGKGKWSLADYRRYRLDHFSESEVINFFVNGKKYLQEICKSVQSDYEVKSFRAGGWSIQPFSPHIKKAFIESGIILDSSVAYGAFAQTAAQAFDFRKAESKQDFWAFEDDPCRAVDSGQFIEVPISTDKVSVWTKIRKKLANKKLGIEFYKISGDGRGITINYGRIAGLLRRFSSSFDMYTLEGRSPEYMIDRLRKSQKNRFVFISHPKGLSKNSFSMVERLYEEGVEFILLEDFLNDVLVK